MDNPSLPVLIASDHAGFALKEEIKSYLQKKKYRLRDLGTYTDASCDYPDYAASLAKEISEGKARQGILICKSGIGNSIVANRFLGVRAALCYNIKAARLARQHNDANVLVLGAAFVKPSLAKRIIAVWLNTPFEGGRHQRRLDKLTKIEKGICQKE